MVDDSDIISMPFGSIMPKTCIVGFASMGDDCGGGIKPFEWANTFRFLEVDLVLMRDRHNVWFQRGIEGVGDIDAVVAYIVGLKRIYKRVITVGISMGGYAALMFGALADVHDIIAMSPQTLLQDDPRWDGHWDRYVRPIMRYDDLAPMCEVTPARMRIFIGDQPPDAEKDSFHAARIYRSTVEILAGCTHSSVGPYLRDTGYFKKLLSE